MTDKFLPQAPVGEFAWFKSDGNYDRIEFRLQVNTLWIIQASMAELYDKDVSTINENLSNIIVDGELTQNSTIRKFRIVRQEGKRQVSREIEHYKGV